jgi:hypothetical protein
MFHFLATSHPVLRTFFPWWRMSNCTLLDAAAGIG